MAKSEEFKGFSLAVVHGTRGISSLDIYANTNQYINTSDVNCDRKQTFGAFLLKKGFVHGISFLWPVKLYLDDMFLWRRENKCFICRQYSTSFHAC